MLLANFRLALAAADKLGVHAEINLRVEHIKQSTDASVAAIGRDDRVQSKVGKAESEYRLLSRVKQQHDGPSTE